MTIATNAFEPRALARMIEIRKRPKLWYADTYFKPAEGVHGARLVELDVLIGGQRLAPLQRPTDRSREMPRETGSDRLIRLPYMKPARPTNAEEIIRRRAVGAHLYAERDLIGAAQRQLGRDIEDLDDMIERRREYMAAQTLVTGTTPLIGLDENGVQTITAEVVWGVPAAHLITLTSTALWTHADSDPLAKLKTWANLIIAGSGTAPTTATVGTAVAEALFKHAKLLELMDNRRVEAGQLELREQSMDGITYLGRFRGVDFYEDARTYTDDSGTAQPFTPVDRLVLGSRNAENRWHYGPISDLKCPNPLTPRWVKTWEVEEPSQRKVAVHSAPLCALHQADSIVSAKVV
ncbi:major capsid protein [Thiocystis violascens]|uniref:Phage major capsid protein E n=1 Tax=Thiocystis violascens (strain ATCC 17096 / DSM 198 / 6111) TaxID=765911 RepID=I3YEI0_THIV6|nr:major capsid protein [Thiocystis violascens]AFL75398.1 Phage major capsid protein E [Thiocystis violascens DSM 198]